MAPGMKTNSFVLVTALLGSWSAHAQSSNSFSSGEVPLMVLPTSAGVPIGVAGDVAEISVESDLALQRPQLGSATTVPTRGIRMMGRVAPASWLDLGAFVEASNEFGAVGAGAATRIGIPLARKLTLNLGGDATLYVVKVQETGNATEPQFSFDVSHCSVVCLPLPEEESVTTMETRSESAGLIRAGLSLSLAYQFERGNLFGGVGLYNQPRIQATDQLANFDDPQHSPSQIIDDGSFKPDLQLGGEWRVWKGLKLRGGIDQPLGLGRYGPTLDAGFAVAFR
jgi:hypothetical protein